MGTGRAAEPTIELYTMGPGRALYASFGHAALCVSVEDRSRCYNYGTTTFQAGSLVRGFLRGSAVFWVASTDRASMLAHYEREGRAVWRQVLPLPLEAKRSLVTRLVHDDRPEYRSYVYDHLRDNCSTRLRDHLDAVTGGALSSETKGAPWPHTYRSHVREGLASDPWVAAATELLLAGPIDQSPSVWEAMFLPTVLQAEVTRVLGVPAELVVPATDAPPPTDPRIGQGMLVGGGILWATTSRLKRLRRGLGLVSIAVTSALGTLFLAVVILAVPRELEENLVPLLFWPTDALLLTRWRNAYAILRAVGIGAPVLASMAGFISQPLFAPGVLAAALLLAGFSATFRRGSAPGAPA